MPETVTDIVSRLDELARYDGPWTPLRAETPIVRERVRELRERQSQVHSLLVVALVGGSGVGKSTLLNALAGDALAETSEFRPCTSVPAVYAPPGASITLEGARFITGSVLENLILIDTPDSDTVLREHRDAVSKALGLCDLIVLCGSPEKYLDEATWTLLRPLQGERTLVCVETKAMEETLSFREHWLERLDGEGFRVEAFFRVNALRAFDRKLAGGQPGPAEAGFEQFERFLREQLDRERIHRIKCANTQGLLVKTVNALRERIVPDKEKLDAMSAAIEEAQRRIVRETIDDVQCRLFSEPHLWVFALAREIRVRTKGFVLGLYRLGDVLRGLTRLAARWLPSRDGTGAGRQAAELLTGPGTIEEGFETVAEALEDRYAAVHSEIRLAFAKAGFDLPDLAASHGHFGGTLRHRLATVFGGAGRERVMAAARRLTCWPLAVVLDAAPIAIAAFAAYRIVRDYFAGGALPENYFVHSAAVIAIITAIDLVAVAVLVRFAAWRLRRKTARDMRLAIAQPGMALKPEQAAIEEALRCIEAINEMGSSMDRLIEKP